MIKFMTLKQDKKEQAEGGAKKKTTPALLRAQKGERLFFNFFSHERRANQTNKVDTFSLPPSIHRVSKFEV